MNTTSTSEGTELSREEEFSLLFGQLVLQQSNMAMMLLGKVAHPETGKTVQDIEAARLFIDQLEMLQAKTKGNLTREEDLLLKQTLMTLRLNFVETVESGAESAKPSSEEKPVAAAPLDIPPERGPTPEAAAGSAEDEHRKKFSKKY